MFRVRTGFSLMSAFVDLSVRIHVLTRTCEACGQSAQFPYAPAKARSEEFPSWREAEQQRDDWWTDHEKECAGVPAVVLAATA